MPNLISSRIQEPIQMAVLVSYLALTVAFMALAIGLVNANGKAK